MTQLGGNQRKTQVLNTEQESSTMFSIQQQSPRLCAAACFSRLRWATFVMVTRSWLQKKLFFSGDIKEMPAFIILQPQQHAWYNNSLLLEWSLFFNVRDFLKIDRHHHTAATRWKILSAKVCMEAVQHYSRAEIRRWKNMLRLHVSFIDRFAPRLNNDNNNKKRNCNYFTCSLWYTLQ